MYSDKQHETYVNVFQLFYFSLDQDKVIHSPKNGHRTYIVNIWVRVSEMASCYGEERGGGGVCPGLGGQERLAHILPIRWTVQRSADSQYLHKL